MTAQAPDALINEHPRVRLHGLHLYGVVRGDITTNHGWGDSYVFATQPAPDELPVRATHLMKGYTARFRLGFDGGIVLEDYQYPSPSFRRWQHHAVGERLTGDFWLVLKPAFLGQRVYVPFRDGRIVEARTAWVIEPYQAGVMRGPRIDLDDLDAFMDAAEASERATEAALARLRERDPRTIPFCELDLWPSTFYPLERAGFNTLGDLCSRTAEELMRDCGLGRL
jgi:hypothetical protein